MNIYFGLDLTAVKLDCLKKFLLKDEEEKVRLVQWLNKYSLAFSDDNLKVYMEAMVGLECWDKYLADKLNAYLFEDYGTDAFEGFVPDYSYDRTSGLYMRLRNPWEYPNRYKKIKSETEAIEFFREVFHLLSSEDMPDLIQYYVE